MSERATIEADGYVVIRGIGSVREFEAYAAGLGVPIAEEQIALREGAHAYVARPGAVPLHTDHPAVDRIGWFCHEQDPVDGANWLLDTRPVLDGLPGQVIEELRRTMLLCQPIVDGAPMEVRPALSGGTERPAIFHPPWRLEPEPITWNRAAHRLLVQRLTAAEAAHRIDIRLAPRDALFVDNTRILHGRGPLEAGSRRRLTRLWVRSSSALDQPPRRPGSSTDRAAT